MKAKIFSITIIVLFFIVFSCKKKEVTMDEIIKLELADTANLQADGKTKIKLTVTLPKDATDEYKKITFETTKGIFDGTNTPTKKELNIDANGKAVVYLSVSTTAGIFYVSASTGSSSVYKVEYPVYARPVSTNNKLIVTISDTTNIRAENYTIFKISATVTNSPESAVSFSINEGFIQGTGNQKDRVVPIDNNGKAEIYVKTDVNAINYMISATINTLTIVNNIMPVRRAYADSMLIEPSSLKIDSVGGSISIKSILSRVNGKVSLQTPVYFESYQIDNAFIERPKGRFTGLSNATTNSTGDVTVNFFADTGMLFKDRPIKIRIKTKKDNGTFIIRVIDVLIK